MRTTKYVTTLLLITLFSCNKDIVIDRENISFILNKDIRTNYDSLTSSIKLQIDEFDFPELDGIKKIKIDTVSFSYVFYIPYTDSLAENTIDRFQGFAAVLSDYKLSGETIHIRLTDDNFKPIQDIEFDRGAYETIAEHYASNDIYIEVDKSVPAFQLGGLSMIIKNKIPSLFTDQDTLTIKVRMDNEDIKVDMTANLGEISQETVKEEFKKIDPLYLYGLFDNRTIYFQLIDKRDGQIKAVFGIPKV